MAIKALVFIQAVDANPVDGMRTLVRILAADGTQQEDNVPTPYVDVTVLTALQINTGIKNWAKQYTIDQWGLEYQIGDDVRLIHAVTMT